MNRVRPGFATGIVECADPSPRRGNVLVELVRCWDPGELFLRPERAAFARVLASYPGAAAKALDYVRKEGWGQTLEKTRTKLDQQRVAVDGMLSAVGIVVGAPDGGFAPGSWVVCGGFQLPVRADRYLLHPDQCREVPSPPDGAETVFYLGALIAWIDALREAGHRGLRLLGLGPLEETAAAYARESGFAVGDGEAGIAFSGHCRGGATLPPLVEGILLDPFGAVPALPPGWRSCALPDAGRFALSPFAPGSIDWPHPWGWEHRQKALARLPSPSRPPEPPGDRPLHPAVALSPSRTSGSPGLSVVGCGNFARAVLLHHARTQGARIRGLCDLRPEVAAVHAASVGAAFHTADFETLLDDRETDAIAVTTDHGSHASHVARALDAGKSAHVEKPPAVAPEQLTSILEALVRNRGCLTIGYNRPFAPAFPVVMEALAAETGPVIAAMGVKGFKLPPAHWYYWPDQGTRIAGNLVHWIDLGHRLVGRGRPATVVVHRDRDAEPWEAGDGLVLSVRYGDGSLFSITFSSAGDDLRGVREWVDVRRGGTTLWIEDFDRITWFRGPRLRRRTFGRDRGHAAGFAEAFRRLRDRLHSIDDYEVMVETSAILFAAQRSFADGGESAVVILEPWRLRLAELGDRR